MLNDRTKRLFCAVQFLVGINFYKVNIILCSTESSK